MAGEPARRHNNGRKQWDKGDITTRVKGWSSRREGESEVRVSTLLFIDYGLSPSRYYGTADVIGEIQLQYPLLGVGKLRGSEERKSTPLTNTIVDSVYHGVL